jgi:transposase
MSNALSFDLRSRVVAAIEGGLSCRQAAERFAISASSAIRWHRAFRERGSFAAGPQGGDRWSARTEAHAGAIDAILERQADITLRELKAELAASGRSVSVSALWRFFRRHAITHKKRPATPPSRIVPPS